MSKRSAKPQEAVSGSYTPLPHALLDSVAFMGASDRAKAMLLELVRQHSGRNNGHLQLAVNWLRKRGWKSTSGIQLAKAELVARGLAVLTSRGGLNAGPDRFALTWLPISDYTGLSEVTSRTYAPGAWRFADPPPILSNRTPPPPNNRKKRIERSDCRNSAVPVEGTASPLTVPAYGTKKAVFTPPTVPAYGNNEVTSSLPSFCSAVGGRKTARAPNFAHLHPGLTFKRWLEPREKPGFVSLFSESANGATR